MSRQETAAGVKEHLDTAVRTLHEAGVASPQADAELLMCHVLSRSAGEGIGRGQLAAMVLTERRITSAEAEAFGELVSERARRIPLQHLTGRAPFRNLELRVGPGVFVPRPETEQVAQVVLEHLADLRKRREAGVHEQVPRVIDLGTGSGALAAAIASEAADYGCPTVDVHAVELSAEAAAWAAINLEPHGVTLHRGDILALADYGFEALPDWFRHMSSGDSPYTQGFDVVVSNPPYIPPGMVPADPEVAEHDPELALYGGGEDGLKLPLAVVQAAKNLLVPGGWFIIEHAEVQADALRGRLEADPEVTEVCTHQDLAGRDRATSAYLTPGSPSRASAVGLSGGAA